MPMSVRPSQGRGCDVWAPQTLCTRRSLSIGGCLVSGGTADKMPGPLNEWTVLRSSCVPVWGTKRFCRASGG